MHTNRHGALRFGTPLHFGCWIRRRERAVRTHNVRYFANTPGTTPIPRFKLKAVCGFTVLELLVTVAIVAILATLLLIGISQAKDRAKNIQCVSNLRQLGIALQGFVADVGAYPLSVNPNFRKGEYPEFSSTWHVALQNSGLSLSKNSTNQLNAAIWLSRGVWRCPAAVKPGNYPSNQVYFSYGYNGYGLSAQSDTQSLGLGGHNVWVPKTHQFPPPPVKEAEVTQPSDMFAIGDGFTGDEKDLRDGGFMLWRTHEVEDFLNSTVRSYSRHQHQANIVFCDGHVQAQPLKSVFKETSDAALARWNRDHKPHRDKL